MKPEVASRRIKSFGQRFGEAHLYLAYHAAFPLALTPDLLYRLWANFQLDIHRHELKIPWLAVADLLLSSLGDEVGYELYEMDTAVRNVLLRELKENPRFGEQRINELSDFLLTYVQQQLESHDPDMRDFAQAQRWTALAYTRPSEAARELALTLSKLKLEEKTEWVRIASLVETFAEPLAEFQPLLIYARAMTNFVRGKQESATAEITSLLANQEPQLQIAGVNLTIPEEIASSSGESRYIFQSPTNIAASQKYINARILVVDDLPDNLFLIHTILESEGYEINLAADGKTALAKVEQSPPDLIILDVIMPEIDGYEVTRRIRNNHNFPYIPILLISAFVESSVVQGLDIGADDFIRKPIDVDELLARVRSLLRLKSIIDNHNQKHELNHAQAFFQTFGTESITKVENSKDRLISQNTLDYTRLRDFLAVKRWQEADQETERLIFKIAGAEKQQWLGVEELKNFPCKSLQEIDKLWVEYSNRHFGFSVQQKIWESFGFANNIKDYNIWWNFGVCVGWRVKDRWIPYERIKFISEAPNGHLPFFRAWIGMRKTGHVHSMHQVNRFHTFMYRCASCKLT